MNYFGEENEEPENKSFYQKHKKKLKIAAGVVGTAVVLAGGHYAAKKYSPKYAKSVKNIKLPFFRKKEDKEPKKKPTNEQDFRKKEDEHLASQENQLLEKIKGGDKDAQKELDELKKQQFEITRQRREEDRRKAAEEAEELKNRKSLLDKFTDTTRQIQTLREDPILGGAINKAVEQIPPLIESFTKENEEELNEAENEVQTAQTNLNEKDDESKENLEHAKERLKEVKEKSDTYHTVVDEIGTLQNKIITENNQDKKLEIIGEISNLKEKLKQLNTQMKEDKKNKKKKKSKSTSGGFGQKRFKKIPKKNLKRLKKDLKRLKRC